MRRAFVLLLMVAFVLPFLAFTPTVSAAPSVEASSCTNSLYRPAGQNFWVGDVTPTNAGGPVVVLVHGYTSDRNTWTGSNLAVRDGCQNGFRVAAVELAGKGSIWDNGSDLKNKLQAIANYFGVSRVNIMAHSKGGLDTQTAIVHYGAYSLVDSYIAFGSPFGGTDLADHACSWYGFWLWQCNDATKNMRISYMSYVRSITDDRPENDYVNGYVARGTKCDWWNPTCALIDGADDGVVPAWSVWANARAARISDRSDLRHGEVHQTQRYGSWLFSYLGRSTMSTAEAEAGVESASRRPQPVGRARNEHTFAASNYTLRGGPLEQRVVEEVTVEGGLSAVDFSLLANVPARVTLVSPHGATYHTTTRQSAPSDLLQGTFHEVRIERPAPGNWQLIMQPTTTQRGGYMLYVDYEGGVTVQLQNNVAALYRPGSRLPLDVKVQRGRPAEAALAAQLHRGNDQSIMVQSVGELQGQSLTLPEEPGIYQLDLRITGTAPDGTPFERTIATSLAVVDPAQVATLSPERID